MNETDLLRRTKRFGLRVLQLGQVPTHRIDPFLIPIANRKSAIANLQERR
ncbi:MAG: hypothetical protein JWN51_1075 [Phycisphaerales bacterium]|nr:hypothetical protein [Phycisphaerales bacterium]